jgi:putative ABC transport system permease protein
MVAVLAVGAGALTFGASLDDLVERRELWGERFEVAVGGQGGGEVPAEVVSVLRERPEIEALALFGALLANIGPRQFSVTGMEAVLGSTAPPVFEGRLAQGADEIAVGRLAARRLGVGVGGELTLVGPAGPRTLRITGIAVIPGMEGATGVGEGGLVTLDGLHQLAPDAVATVATIRFRPDAPDDAAEGLSSDLGIPLGPPDRPDVIANVARVRTIPYVIAAILGALALLNLAHQLIVSTQRRRRDLAVLQALGADRGWVSSVVHWQATLFTVAVVSISAPLGIVGGRVVYRAFVDRIGALDAVALPLAALAIAVVALVALANLVAAPNAHRACRLHHDVLTAG